ncbi:MAG: hypothetical protein PWQ82_791 [Thermosediminibacterales bacterium]|nr:hypothetical protein [Thermosediminibacterales bacterium]MDK2835636.1 hypothetical protein [Thermosediminibacterales bacterium]
MKKIKEKISDILELPKDVVLNLPKITLVGDVQLYIENHRGILEYNRERVKIKTNLGEIIISGSDLKIKTVMFEEIIVEGSIKGIQLEK